ncbi:hypothetical protein BV25DRAFT_1810491 [Artomyces pyxidatus]|uniref:Uncharacterized protein n=1 Tax=Artomyces pyxidatus TaxID=48021 RepID=A0ACB8SQ16_9AGAM|nr:hypothetical protein BV25DRAFT_1810491 [Artomyces pyxidatus]
MASTRYAPLPNPRASPDAEREMDDAFDDDYSDHGENTPLTIDHPSTSPTLRVFTDNPPQEASTGVYDFERDYDCPPPGSPPDPSSFAFPNNYGNSNGQIPTSPIARAPRPSFLRRAVGAVLPSYYQRVPAESRAIGGGIDNDGVFANVTAKPSRAVQMRTENGDVYMVPEDVQAEAPPSYAAASADAAPAYWETTVHAPSATDLNGDMIVDELPTGSLITFFFTALVSWFFQLPGFILTYLLHGTHAGKFGSQAGLALTLIQYGFGATMNSDYPGMDSGAQEGDMGMGLGLGAPFPDMRSLADLPPPYVGHEWVSFILMTIGWFLLLTSLVGYFRVKRFEMSVRASRSRGPAPLSTEDLERDRVMRRNLEEVFGITIAEESVTQTTEHAPPSVTPRALDMGEARREEELRLEADLRAAGLL